MLMQLKIREVVVHVGHSQQLLPLRDYMLKHKVNLRDSQNNN